jgi:hypothetical protein
MEYRKRALVSRSHLLRMAALSQRAVDCATKAYELQDSRFLLQLQDLEYSLCELQRIVGARGRDLQDAGTLDDDSLSGSCTLQIYSGLQISFAAAREIAQNALFLEESREVVNPMLPRWQQAARFANSLVTLNTVALLKEQIRYAELILQASQHPSWPREPVDQALRRGILLIDATAAFESCVIRCLCVIADQALDIACAIVRWLGSENCAESAAESAGSSRKIDSQNRLWNWVQVPTITKIQSEDRCSESRIALRGDTRLDLASLVANPMLLKGES